MRLKFEPSLEPLLYSPHPTPPKISNPKISNPKRYKRALEIQPDDTATLYNYAGLNPKP